MYGKSFVLPEFAGWVMYSPGRRWIYFYNSSDCTTLQRLFLLLFSCFRLFLSQCLLRVLGLFWWSGTTFWTNCQGFLWDPLFVIFLLLFQTMAAMPDPRDCPHDTKDSPFNHSFKKIGFFFFFYLILFCTEMINLHKSFAWLTNPPTMPVLLFSKVSLEPFPSVLATLSDAPLVLWKWLCLGKGLSPTPHLSGTQWRCQR